MKKGSPHPSIHATPPEAVDTRLGRAIRAGIRRHPAQQSGVHLLHEGLPALAARATLIEEAVVSLDLQYYVYADDTSGAMLAEKLLEAADRGVCVRLLVDDLGTRMTNPWIAALDSHPNMQVRIFNPVGGHRGLRKSLVEALNLWRINHRMHNKLLIADGLAIILGGRNVSDRYFSDAEVEFLDIDVIAIGAVVAEAASTFNDFWSSPASVPVSELSQGQDGDNPLHLLRARLVEYTAGQSESIRTLRNSTLAKTLVGGNLAFHWGNATLFSDPPEKVMDHKRIPLTEYPGYQLKKVVQNLRRRLLISNAYFIPGRPGMHLLCELMGRGVEVGILTNGLSTNDTAAAHGAYSRYRKSLLRAGAKLWELRPTAERQHRLHWFRDKSRATLHAKAFVMDGNCSFVGSINLDSRSILYNTEIGILIESSEINRQLDRIFTEWTAPDAAWRLELGRDGNITWYGAGKDGHEIAACRDPQSTFWQRFLSWLLSILPIDSQI